MLGCFSVDLSPDPACCYAQDILTPLDRRESIVDNEAAQV